MRKSVKKLLSYSLTIMLVLGSFFITGCDLDKKKANNNENQEVVKKTYNVTFDSAGGTEVASQTVTEGETARKPIDPTKEGYAFAGWMLDGSRYYFSSTVTSDITLVAEWTKVEEVWVVTLDKQNGSSAEKVNVKKGEKFEKPVDPEKEEYIFVEWQLNGKKYDFNAPVTSDITLLATWKEKTYTIKFDSAGGTSVANQTLTKGKTVTKPSKNPTKSGWTFVNWTLDGKAYDFKSEVAKDITLVATWKLEKAYTKAESITKKINKKNVKIDFRYLTKEKSVDLDIFVNDIKAINIPVITDDDECDVSSICESDISEVIKTIKNNIKTINGDKEYFVFEIYAKKYIVNDIGILLYNKELVYQSQASFALIDSSCLNYSKFKNPDDLEFDKLIYIGTDGIYYLDAYTQTQAKEMKISVNKNKVTDSQVAICGALIGEKAIDNLHIITKTQKVNGKDVNLEYRFNNTDDSIFADLYINNKKVASNVYSDYFTPDEKDNLDKLIMFHIDDAEYSINYWKNVSAKLGKTIGTIKGDKEYLYVKSLNNVMGTESELIVFDANYNIIWHKNISSTVGELRIDKLCQNINLFSSEDGDNRYVPEFAVINNNVIYYFKGEVEMTDFDEHLDLFNQVEIENGLSAYEQYKVEFKGDKAIETKIDVCVGYNEGEKLF